MSDRFVIRTRANGPYLVQGPVTLIDPDGHERFIPEGQNVALCRCGHSANKPFCDSSHKRVDFVSRPTFAPEPEEPEPSGM